MFMGALAIMSREKVGYGEKAPFDGVTGYILIGLYNVGLNSGTVTRMMRHQRENEVEEAQKKSFSPGKAIDKKYNSLEPLKKPTLEKFKNIAAQYAEKVEIRD